MRTPGARAPVDPGARALLRRCFRIARRLQLVGLVAGLVWRGAAIATPWVLQRAIDDGVVADDRTALWAWAGVLVLLGVASWTGDAVRHLYVERGAYRALVDTRRRALAALIDADPDRASVYSPGEVISRIVDDCIRLRTWISGSVTTVIGLLTVVVVVGLIAALDPVLALVAIAIVPLSAVLAVTQSAANIDAALRSVSSAGQTSAWIEASISGVDTVKGLGAESVVVERAADRAARVRSDAVGLARIRARWIASATAIPGLGTAVGLLVGGGRAIDGDVSVGQLVAFTGWMGLLASATALLTARLALRGTALAAAQRLSIVLALPPHPASMTSGEETSGEDSPATTDERVDRVASAARGTELVVDAVGVERGGHPIVEGASFIARPGEWVALVGAIGTGKSSLLRTISGDLRTTAGRISLDGIDVSDVAWPARSGAVALVPQHPAPLTGTIGDVVRRGAPEATDGEVRRVLGALALGGLVDDLGGLDGRIGERGRTVSGGQRQRLALASAILRRPPLLLLDDATSALDEDVEAAVLTSLRSLTAGMTIVLTTHREAPAAVADTVVDMTQFAVARPVAGAVAGADEAEGGPS
ncbi:MAG: ABC transporter ATP-binding protein [Actinomycetota bacterium]